MEPGVCTISMAADLWYGEAHKTAIQTVISPVVRSGRCIEVFHLSSFSSVSLKATYRSDPSLQPVQKPYGVSSALSTSYLHQITNQPTSYLQSHDDNRQPLVAPQRLNHERWLSLILSLISPTRSPIPQELQKTVHFCISYLIFM